MGIPRLVALLFLLCILSILFPAHGETLVGRVVGVHDGDTLTLLDAQKRQTKVRLAEIDTPGKQTALRLAIQAGAVRPCVQQDRPGRDPGHRPIWPHGGPGVGRLNRCECRNGGLRRCLGLPAIFKRSRSAAPGGRGESGRPGIVGAARGAAHAALGMATGAARGKGGLRRFARAGLDASGDNPSKFKLFVQPAQDLRPDGKLRRGGIPPAAMREFPAGSGWRWHSLRDDLPVRCICA